MKSIKLVFVLVMLLMMTVTGLAQEPQAVTVTGGDEALLRELISALVHPGPGGPEVEVIVGGLPQNLPFELPVPQDSFIIGSIDRGSFGGTEIWMRSAQDPNTVIESYASQLKANGWVEPEGVFGQQQGGFTPVIYRDAGFCYEEGFIYVSAQERSADSTTLVVRYDNANMPPFCMENGTPQEMGNDPFRMLPVLEFPEGVSVRPERFGRGGGGGGGGYSAFSATVLIANMSAQEIAPLFDVQLEAAGWGLVEGTASEHQSWSTWLFSDDEGEQWRGLFTLTLLPASSNEYYAELYVERVN